MIQSIAKNSIRAVSIMSLVTSLGVFNTSVVQAAAEQQEKSVVALATTNDTDKPLLDKAGKSKPVTSENVEVLPDSIVPVDTAPKEVPQEKKSNTSTYVYAGLGIAAAVGLVAAIGGGGGGSSSSSTTPPTVEPVGADIAGTNWSGKLLLANGKTANVTATVYQSGSVVRITTNSTLEYGKQYSGTISKDAIISVSDQTTGIAWTTKNGAATWNSIDLFGLAAGTTAYDELLLYRSSK